MSIRRAPAKLGSRTVSLTIDSPGLIALAQGAGSGLVVDMAIRRFWPHRRTAILAVGLAAAGAVYPLSRRRFGMDTAETVQLLAACAVAATAVRLPSPTTRRVLGVGWVAHALYDAVFTHDAANTRLPSTYAASCAGADIAIGASLILV